MRISNFIGLVERRAILIVCQCRTYHLCGSHFHKIRILGRVYGFYSIVKTFLISRRVHLLVHVLKIWHGYDKKKTNCNPLVDDFSKDNVQCPSNRIERNQEEIWVKWHIIFVQFDIFDHWREKKNAWIDGSLILYFIICIDCHRLSTRTVL